MTARQHELLFYAVLIAYAVAFACVASAKQVGAGVDVEYRQCSIQIDDYAVVYSPDQKGLPPDVAGATSHSCWTVKANVDTDTAAYYHFIGANIQVAKKK